MNLDLDLDLDMDMDLDLDLDLDMDLIDSMQAPTANNSKWIIRLKRPVSRPQKYNDFTEIGYVYHPGRSSRIPANQHRDIDYYDPKAEAKVTAKVATEVASNPRRRSRKTTRLERIQTKIKRFTKQKKINYKSKINVKSKLYSSLKRTKKTNEHI